MVVSSINPQPAMTTQPTALDTYLQRLPLILDKIEALQQLAEPDLGQLTSSLAAFEADYEALKSALLAAGATGAARIFDMEEALRRHSALRRAVQQAVKAHRPESDPLTD